MGERRKRKSLWDQEEETKQSFGESQHNSWTGKEHDPCHDIGRNSGFSASGSYAASRDHSEQPSLTSIVNTPVAPMRGSFLKTIQDAPEGKEVGGGNRDYQNMSLGFDGTGQDKLKQNLGNGRGRSDRYTRRGRSRSRSRSRTRGRSRSRSLSRGRGRERGRGRSRSSSRSDGGSARGRMRSHSPRVDYKRQSYGWSDKRSAPDKSSRICRDFAAGKCRRGGQCRFFHHKSVSHEDGEALGDNTGESRRDTSDYVQISKSSINKGPQSDLRGDASDPYHRQDSEFRNNGKNAVPCKDFTKGRCRWGDSCRFAHHLDNDATYEKSTQNKSFSKDIEQQPDKNGKVICKYFAAGNCDRGNCRFSHENPKLNNLDGRQDEVAKDPKSHDMNSWRSPTSNDASRISDNVKSGGWSETIGTVTNSISEPTEAKNDNRWGHVLENENKVWRIPRWPDNSMNLDKQPVVHGTIGGYGGGMEIVESIGKEELADKPDHLRLHGSHLQNLEGNAKVQGQNTVQQDSKYFMELRRQHVPPILHVQQQHHGVAESNLGTSLMSSALDEVKKSGNAAQSSLFSGQNLNQNGENVFTGLSSILGGTGSGQNMLSHIPTIESSDILNMPHIHEAAPLNLESQMQNHLKVVQATRILETKLPHLFPSLLTSLQPSQLADSTVAITDQHVAPAAIPSIFPNQGFVNEQPQKNTELDASNSQGVAPFSDISGNVPLVNSANVQFNQVKVSHDSKESGRGINEHGNHTEQGSGMKAGQSYPLPTAGKEPDDLKGIRSGNQKVNQETPHTDPEVDKSEGDNGNENKGEQNNKHSAPLDSHGKVEEKSVSNDDKAMRTFKNSLIEFVKDILKPTWKEGQMSRDIHKTIVKKVVEKVTSTIQVDHIPKTQDKVEQYLSYSKPKIAKLVQAYVARCLKTDSGGDK